MSELVTVYASQGMLRAQVIKSKLEAAGVPVLLRYESVGLVLGLTVDGLGLVQVQVPAEWTEEARGLLVESPANEEDLPGDAQDVADAPRK